MVPLLKWVNRMAILDDARLAVRISTTAYNEEITGLIEACEIDLETAGVLKVDNTDALIKRAILMYCKANFGYENPDYERLNASYLMLRNHLAMSLDYSAYKVEITASEQGTIVFDGIAKMSNADGVAVFYTLPKDHVAYIVDGVSSYVDITADTVIGGE